MQTLDIILVTYLIGVGIFASMFDHRIREKNEREFHPLIVFLVSALWFVWVIKAILKR